MNDTRPGHDSEDYSPAGDLIAYAHRAEQAVRDLAQLTMRAPGLTPADVDAVLSHLAEAVAAVPHVASQLGAALDRTRDTHQLAMDGMTSTTDPDLAIDTARLHLDEARHPALATYRRLNAARTEVAHISATAIDDLDETPPPGSFPRRREDQQPPTHLQPTRGSRGPAR